MNAVFKALNNQTRREILRLLKEGDMNAGQIAAQFHMTKPSISHHLDILKRADLVATIKDGQFIIYAINTSVVEDLFQWVYDLKQSKNEETVRPGTASLDFNPDPDSLSRQ